MLYCEKMDGDEMLEVYLSLIEKDENKNKLTIIYENYRNAMYNAAFSILDNKEDAEDAVHEAFLYYSKNESKIPDIENPHCKAYVCEQSANRARKIYKKRKNRNDHIDIEDEKVKECIEDADESVLDSIISEESYSMIVDALNELPEKYTKVLYMHYVEDLSAKEISERTDTKRKTVEKQLLRGRTLWIKRIKEAIKYD